MVSAQQMLDLRSDDNRGRYVVLLGYCKVLRFRHCVVTMAGRVRLEYNPKLIGAFFAVRC